MRSTIPTKTTAMRPTAAAAPTATHFDGCSTGGSDGTVGDGRGGGRGGGADSFKSSDEATAAPGVGDAGDVSSSPPAVSPIARKAANAITTIVFRTALSKCTFRKSPLITLREASLRRLPLKLPYYLSKFFPIVPATGIRGDAPDPGRCVSDWLGAGKQQRHPRRRQCPGKQPCRGFDGPGRRPRNGASSGQQPPR